MERLKLALQKFLLFKEIRYPVGLLRYYYYRYIVRRLRSYDGKQEHLGHETLAYNFSKIRRSVVTHDRVLHMIWPLIAIENISKNKRHMKTLSVGPRSEGELLLIAAHGFTWKNIRGVDLFSYSPRIDVADMHDLPYPDNSFDIFFSGWTLAYSDDQPRALKEMVRVLKPGGYVAFGQGFVWEVDHSADENWIGGKTRSNNIDEIFAPISGNIDHFYFRHETTPVMAKNDLLAILAVFSIKK